VARQGRAAAGLAAALLLVAASNAHCPSFCNGHGRCVGVNKCHCFSKWGGGDCSQRLCPQEVSWNDIAMADETAHAPAACSDRGTCDFRFGSCQCHSTMEGAGCQRMKCPRDCGGHGRCRSLRTLNMYRDEGVASFAYDTNWDADKIHGCECDEGHGGFDCSQRVCPLGDDPMTQGQADEVQLLRCDLDPAAGQSFVLRFRRETTAVIPASATAADLETALEALPTVGHVQVRFLSASGAVTTFCSSATTPSDNVVEITFLDDHGDVPNLIVLSGDGNDLTGAAAAGISLAYDGGQLARSGGTAVVSVRGTKEALPCSGRGACDRSLGACRCFTGFASSNGRGVAGDQPDCGFASSPITSCPGVSIECSGHGRCSGHPEYACTCNQGWMGGDCAERTCPSGPAWLDLASAPNVAHAPAECSSRGVCNRALGKCECQEGFSGEACQKLACPGITVLGGAACSGHGTCYSMEGLAQEATTNGVATPFTYGRDRNGPTTWDFRSNHGCICHAGWQGYDCSLRSCPRGDDPTTTGQFDEVQTITCSHTSGTPSFQLRFRRQVTRPIQHTSTAADIEAALEALTSVGDVTVGFNAAASQACSTGGTTTITVTFRTENGDVPPIEVVEGAGFSQGVDLTLPGSLKAAQASAGTTEHSVCSERGICNHETGNCECFLGYGSSDGSGGPGSIANCGFIEPFAPQSIDRSKVDARTAAALAWASATKAGTY